MASSEVHVITITGWMLITSENLGFIEIKFLFEWDSSLLLGGWCVLMRVAKNAVAEVVVVAWAEHGGFYCTFLSTMCGNVDQLEIVPLSAHSDNPIIVLILRSTNLKPENMRRHNMQL